MKKTVICILISLSVICGSMIGDYFINNRFLDISTVRVSRTTTNNYTTVDGIVKEGGKREIKSDLPFNVSKLYVKVGESVKPGQKLADVDYSGIITKFKIAAAEQQYNNNYESLIKLAENKQKYISSPINGIITSINCSEGNDFFSDNPAFIITDTENITVKFKLSIENLNELYVGQKAYIYQNEKICLGKVSKIYPLSDDTSNENLNMITADITPESNHMLVCGSSVEIKLVNEPYENIILIPFDSILYDDNAPYVYVNSSGYAIKKYITIGKEFGTEAEIISGLNTDDRVILSPRKLKISEGMKVTENPE